MIDFSQYPHVPSEQCRVELRIKNSRFIATAGPAPDLESAKEFVTRIKTEFPDATHNVPAWLVGTGSSVIAHCNDDGEPSGTAGKPMLAVLQGSGLGDIAIVVTRYFGGTKLGTGGLVQAYSESVKAVVEELKTEPKIDWRHVSFEADYSIYDLLQRKLENTSGEIVKTEFTDRITLKIRFPQEFTEKETSHLCELFFGKMKRI